MGVLPQMWCHEAPAWESEKRRGRSGDIIRSPSQPWGVAGNGRDGQKRAVQI